MKKFQTLMLSMLVAFVGFAVQSCGSDDDNKDRQQYTLTAELTSTGNLTDAEIASFQNTLAGVNNTVTATESEAKKALDLSVDRYKDAFKNTENKNYTITFILKNASGKVVYQKALIIEGQNVTVK